MKSLRLTMKKFDYFKKDGIVKNMMKFNRKNLLLGIFGYTFIFIINRSTDKNLVWALSTLFFMFGWSYFSHIVSHQPWGKKIFMNYHPKHHDHSISQKLIWRLVEYIYMDFVIFGGSILIPINILFEKMGGIRIFNYYIVLYWSLIYATHHAFNWHSDEKLTSHFHHHKDMTTNYGPEFMDILFGTKMDEDLIEDMNSLVFNNCAVMALFLLF